MDISIIILRGLFIVVSVLMILVILMQRPKSEGLGAAFGGGVTENIFGAQTTNVLTKITGWFAAIFFVLTFVLSILYAHQGNTKSDLRPDLMKGETPVSATAPVPNAPSPGPSSAVGPPGTVTNLAPATNGPVPSVKPSDLAVGAVPPATTSQPVATPPTPESSPAPTQSPSVGPSVSANPKP